MDTINNTHTAKVSNNWMRDEVEETLSEYMAFCSMHFEKRYKIIDKLTIQKIEYARKVFMQCHSKGYISKLTDEFIKLDLELQAQIILMGGKPIEYSFEE